MKPERLAVQGADPGSSLVLPLPPGPLPMETIEKMAGLCMRDLDEEEEETDEDDVEADDELLVRGQGRLGWMGAPFPCAPHTSASAPLTVCPSRRSSLRFLEKNRRFWSPSHLWLRYLSDDSAPLNQSPTDSLRFRAHPCPPTLAMGPQSPPPGNRVVTTPLPR